jgi:hypothetical protein
MDGRCRTVVRSVVRIWMLRAISTGDLGWGQPPGRYGHSEIQSRIGQRESGRGTRVALSRFQQLLHRARQCARRQRSALQSAEWRANVSGTHRVAIQAGICAQAAEASESAASTVNFKANPPSRLGYNTPGLHRLPLPRRGEVVWGDLRGAGIWTASGPIGRKSCRCGFLRR